MKSFLKIRLVVLLCTVMTLPVCAQAADADTQTGTSLSEAELSHRLDEIENRLQRAKLVVHKLKLEYVKAAEDSEAMKKAGISEKEVQHIDRQFKRKVKMMIDRAVEAINDA